MSFGLNRRIDYALVALASLATRRAAAHQPVSARVIARDDGLPEPMLMNLFKKLHAAGLLHSRRGSLGGYWLAKDSRHITVAEVILAVEGPVKLTPCCSEDDHDACTGCRIAVRCPVTVAIRRLSDQINQLLGNVTIAELIDETPRANPSTSPRLTPLHTHAVVKEYAHEH